MRWSGWMVVVAACVAFGVAARAQEGEAPAPAAGTGEVTRLTPAAEQRGLDTLVTVNVRDMYLAQAAHLVAREAGVNLIIGDDVKGVVTCALKNVTVRSALQSLLFANGYTTIEKDGVLVVIRIPKKPEPEAAAEKPTIVRKTFYIPYTGREPAMVPSSGGISSGTGGGSSGSYQGGAGAGAGGAQEDVADTIRKMLSPGGKMAYYQRQHLIVIEDYEPVVALIGDFVQALWEVPAQVFIDSKLVELTLDEGEAMGINWSIAPRIGDSGRGTHVGPGIGLGAPTPYPGTLGISTARNNATVEATPFQFGIVNAHIEAVAQAIHSRGRVDLHSNPRVLVMNHQKATIVVGQEIPYLSSVQTTITNPVNTYEFKEVAVRLDVVPHVSSDGVIFMDVHPQVKNKIGEVGDPPQPVLSVREAVTYVAVPDGGTLLIGGLVQRNINSSTWRVPFISRIPILGLLFRQRRDSDAKNDLVFLLNPRVLTAEFMKGLLESKAGLLTELAPHPVEQDAAKMKKSTR